MRKNPHMATNITINDRLIEDARRAGGHRTKKEAVTTALEEYIRRHRQRRILEAFGTFDFDSSYDHRAERRKKRMG
jgi:Arc/MetJ family transcription regulator